MNSMNKRLKGLMEQAKSSVRQRPLRPAPLARAVQTTAPPRALTGAGLCGQDRAQWSIIVCLLVVLAVLTFMVLAD